MRPFIITTTGRMIPVRWTIATEQQRTECEAKITCEGVNFMGGGRMDPALIEEVRFYRVAFG